MKDIITEYNKLRQHCRELILSANEDSVILGMEINVTYRFFPLVRKLYLKYTRKGRRCYECNDKRRDRMETILISELEYSAIWVRRVRNRWAPHIHHRINTRVPMLVRTKLPIHDYKDDVYVDYVYVLNSNLRHVPSADGDIDMYSYYVKKTKSKKLKKY